MAIPTTPNTVPWPTTFKPQPGLIYNPISADRLKQIEQQWQSMSPEAQRAAERNQAAAVAAAQRMRERKEREAEMQKAVLQNKRDRYREALALQRRQEREYKTDRQAFNRDLTARQQQRVLAQQTLRANRAERLKIQRANEAKSVAKQRKANKERQTILARNRRTEQINKANERKTLAANVRRQVGQQRNLGLAGARNYFETQGTEYAPYAGVVNAELRKLLSTLNPGEIPSKDFTANLGEDVYNKLQGQTRARAATALRGITDTGFEERMIGDPSINPALDAIRNEHFGEAQGYIDNLLKRGVITQPGYQKALQNLQGQIPVVQTQLQDIGSDVLAGGRQKLTDIGNKANLQAGNLALGQKFNATPVLGNLQAAVKAFQTGLPGALKTQIQGPLFDTSKLANIAGMASGAQNTAFDPYALQNTARPTQPLFDSRVGMKSVF